MGIRRGKRRGGRTTDYTDCTDSNQGRTKEEIREPQITRIRTKRRAVVRTSLESFSLIRVIRVIRG
jgi:hypothetical protein